MGATPTADFLQQLGFPDDNPPNAALVIEGGGTTEIAVVRQFAPTYDDAARTATYQVVALAEWGGDTGAGLSERPGDLAALTPSFGAAHLFIDDCPNLTVFCDRNASDDSVKHIGQFDDVPTCWNYSLCIPCEPYGHDQPDRCATPAYWEAKCNETYPEGCQNLCGISTSWPGSQWLCV